jgi:hypothetical protein
MPLWTFMTLVGNGKRVYVEQVRGNDFRSALKEWARAIEVEGMTEEARKRMASWEPPSDAVEEFVWNWDSGVTSLYFSGGGGVLGGHSHEAVRLANAALLAEANHMVARMRPTSTYPLQAAKTTTFYARTDSGVLVAGGVDDPLWTSPRLVGELIRHDLQLPEVVFRESQILGVGPDGFDGAKDVNDADRVFLGVLTGGLGQDLVDELANAADASAADHPERLACGEPANSEAIGVLARVED